MSFRDLLKPNLNSQIKSSMEIENKNINLEPNRQEPNQIMQNPSQKLGIKRIRKEDYSKCELLHISYPQKIEGKQLKKDGKTYTKKKWFVIVTFKDMEGKTRQKLVRFGKEGNKSFVEGCDEKQRIKNTRKAHNDNWLHSSFYDTYLLNNKSDLYENYCLLVKYLNTKPE